MDRPRFRRPIAPTLVAIGLLLAGCGANASSGSGGSPTSGGSSGAQSAVAYAACMRQHGIPNYPDPDQNGLLPKGGAQQFGVSQSQYHAAKRACQPSLPTSGSLQDQVRQCSLAGNCSPRLVQQMMSGGRKLAQCMRDRGISKWPDPKLGGPNHTPMFPVSEAGLTRSQTHSSQMRSTAEQCGRQPGTLMLPMG